MFCDVLLIAPILIPAVDARERLAGEIGQDVRDVFIGNDAAEFEI